MTYKYSGIEKNQGELTVVFKRSTETLDTLETMGREPEAPGLYLRVEAERLTSAVPTYEEISLEAWLDARARAVTDINESNSTSKVKKEITKEEISLLSRNKIARVYDLPSSHYDRI